MIYYLVIETGKQRKQLISLFLWQNIQHQVNLFCLILVIHNNTEIVPNKQINCLFERVNSVMVSYNKFIDYDVNRRYTLAFFVIGEFLLT